MSVADIKTDYNRGDSATFTTLLNADHANIKAALLAVGSAGSLTRWGAGRFAPRDYTVGRIVGDGATLNIRVPNAVYLINGEEVTVDEVAGFALIPVVANLAAGQYAYLSQAVGGGVEVLPGNWRDVLATDLPGLPNLGKVSSDATHVTAIDYSETDEILRPADVTKLLIGLQDQINALGTGGGGGGGGGGAARADLLPWSATELTTMTTVKVQALIDALRAELKDYVDNGTSRPMQMPLDHLVELVHRVAVGVIELNPQAGERLESAIAHFGFFGHAPDGSPPPAAGIGDTPNYVLYTTLTVDTPNRNATP